MYCARLQVDTAPRSSTQPSRVTSVFSRSQKGASDLLLGGGGGGKMGTGIPQYITVYHNIPQYSTIYHSIPQYTTIYHSIPQYTTVY